MVWDIFECHMEQKISIYCIEKSLKSALDQLMITFGLISKCIVIQSCNYIFYKSQYFQELFVKSYSYHIFILDNEFLIATPIQVHEK